VAGVLHDEFEKKLETIRARVPGTIKEALHLIAIERGESDAVILREALTFYISALARRRSRSKTLGELLDELEHARTKARHRKK